MVRFMMGTGKKIKRMEKENSFTPMEIYMRANGKTIKQTDSESIGDTMEENTKDFGEMIYRKGRAMKNGILPYGL
jgi:hypothetical protein